VVLGRPESVSHAFDTVNNRAGEIVCRINPETNKFMNEIWENLINSFSISYYFNLFIEEKKIKLISSSKNVTCILIWCGREVPVCSGT